MDKYTKLARKSVETYVRDGRYYVPGTDDLTEEMKSSNAGAFVSIHKFGVLRGCIGTIEGIRENLAYEIVHNAVSAATQDPRFPTIISDELDDLEISVDVLGAAERIESTDDLDVKKYGVIVEKDERRGLLLPDLEGIDTPDHQVLIAKHKAGISASEDVTLYRFEVKRHG